MSVPHVVVLATYSVALILFGLWMGRRVTQTTDFFVAGRALGPGLMFATVLAANIGAGTTVSAAGFGYRDGLSAWWWVGSAAMGTMALAWWVGPKIRDLAAEKGFLTTGDFLEYRYGAAARATMAGLLWVGTLAILAAQLVALSFVLDVVAGVPRGVGVVIGGVVMTTYFAAGGLVGAAWINLVQLIVLLGAFAVAVPWLLVSIGGFDGLAARLPEVPSDFFHPVSGGQSGIVFLPLLAPAFIVSPGLLQKVYGAKSRRAVRWGVGLSACALLLFAFVPALMGMMARALHPELLNREYALPMLFLENVPVVVGAIGLGALFMADISSADAILFMLATSLSQDFYRRFVRPDATDRQVLRVARIAAVGGGAVAVGLAVIAPTAAAALIVFYSLVGVVLFVPVIAGLYTGRAGGPEVFAAFGSGIVTTLVVRLATDNVGFGWITPNVAGLVASLVAFSLLLFIRVSLRAAPML